ncbi:MAG TPA: ABC transporter ATP-binding protein [Candidatus Acidoferrales bacterium]|nr:ABC transporter ATP-binding protein [Candidatus Acidoferrales bacterium]
MIEVENLTKQYGAVRAVDSVSFRVDKGEILGFLGPNGAGKTTTMRILTGFLPATDGTARVAGFDVFEKSLDVRKRIGYLPENPPIYPEMSVVGYLDAVARLKQVPSDRRKARVDAAMEMAHITDKRAELIKRLSRGYKQRVGLAQALVHDPEVIILDEPTVGLDPKQIIEVRHLIKGLAGNHTIILSTHILPEVSMTCDRVVIIHEGRIVANMPVNAAAQARGSEVVFVELKPGSAGAPAAKALLERVAGVKHVEMQAADGAGRVQLKIECEPGRDLRGRIAADLVRQGHELFELRASRASLEDIFLQVTTQESPEAAPAEGAAGAQP